LPFLAAAGIGAAGSIGSGILGFLGAGKAAKAQEQSAQAAINAQLGMFNQTRQTLAPFVSGGTNAMTQLQALLGIGPGGAGGMQSTLAATPGYQFAFQQGEDALTNSLAARGVGGGNAAKAIAGYGQGLASQTYQQQIANLLGLTGIGESAAAQQGSFGTSTGNSLASLLTGSGNAQAAGIIGQGNALAGGINSLGQAGLNYALLSQLLNNPSSINQLPAAQNPGYGGAPAAGGLT